MRREEARGDGERTGLGSPPPPNYHHHHHHTYRNHRPPHVRFFGEVKLASLLPTMNTDSDLPRSNVRRIVKQKITELKGVGGSDIHLNRDALTALSEACRVFIHLISATANDICLENKRQTISVDDVIGELVPNLRGGGRSAIATEQWADGLPSRFLHLPVPLEPEALWRTSSLATSSRSWRGT